MLPAVGQGALGIETRALDQRTRAAVAAIDDAPTHASVVAERALLLTLLGGCLAPVGAWGRTTDNGQLELDAVVLSTDGGERLAAAGMTSDLPDAADLGRHVAEILLAQGAAALIEQSRRA
jgi:hydroxymethylbilane synthase